MEQTTSLIKRFTICGMRRSSGGDSPRAAYRNLNLGVGTLDGGTDPTHVRVFLPTNLASRNAGPLSCRVACRDTAPGKMLNCRGPMTDAWIPLACKYCGKALAPSAGHVEPGPPDVILFCSAHGPMGRLEDFAKAAASEAALKPALAEFERVLLGGVTKESGE
jgi:hypothetical protein